MLALAENTALFQRGCPCSCPLHGSVPITVQSFSKPTYGVTIREGAEPGRPNKLQPSSNSLLPFLSPQLLTAALPREGKDLGGCRDCLSFALPVTSCLPLSCSHHAPHQPAYRKRKTEECSRRSMRLGLDQRCPSLLLTKKSNSLLAQQAKSAS